MYRAYIILGLIFITVCVSIVNYKYLKKEFLRYFIYFIWYTFLNELTGILLIEKGFNVNIIYNSYSFISTIFFLLFFRNLIKKLKIKKTIVLMLVLFSVSVLLNSILKQNIYNTLQTNTFIFGFLIVIVTILLFFIQILDSDAILKLNKLPVFWISIGIFSFSISIVPVMVIAKFIGWRGVYDYILLGANIIMYGCFTYGFSLTKKEYNI